MCQYFVLAENAIPKRGEMCYRVEKATNFQLHVNIVVQSEPIVVTEFTKV